MICTTLDPNNNREVRQWYAVVMSTDIEKWVELLCTNSFRLVLGPILANSVV